MSTVKWPSIGGGSENDKIVKGKEGKILFFSFLPPPRTGLCAPGLTAFFDLINPIWRLMAAYF